MASLAQEGCPDSPCMSRETGFEIPLTNLEPEKALPGLGAPDLFLCLGIDSPAAARMDEQVFLWGSSWSPPMWS